MSYWRPGFAWIISVIVLAGSISEAAAKRIALIVGNDSYQTLSPLKNSENDARAIAKSLRSVGFEVTTLFNGDQRAMKRAFLEFSRTIRTDVEATFIYYAGHGVQVEGENYLMPVDANVSSEDEVALESINANDFLQVLKGSSGQVNIVVLDACRNNPFPTSFRSANAGLAAVLAPRGTFIAYSTAPGAVAFDGGGTNSAYAAALATTILEPGLELAQVFRRVRQRVLTATNDKQTPWESSSIVGDFYFSQAQASDSGEMKAAEEWKVLRDSKDEKALQNFAQRHAGNPFADLATARIAALKSGSNMLIVGADTPAPSPESGTKLAAIVKPEASTAPAEANAGQAGIDRARRAAEKIGTVRAWQLFMARFGSDAGARSIAMDGMRNLLRKPGNSMKTANAADREALLLPTPSLRLAVQNELAGRGFDIGSPDGVFGGRTRAAIAALQTSLGVTSDGYFNVDLFASLGTGWYAPPSVNFRSDDLAKTYFPDDLAALGEDPAIVKLVRCIWPRSLVYGKYQGKPYAAVIGSIGYTPAQTSAKLGECGLHLVSIGSRAENDFVYSLIENDQIFWSYGSEGGYGWKEGPMIGLVQAPGSAEPRGGWRWTNGDQSTYRNWRQDQPSNTGGFEQYTSFQHSQRGSRGIREQRADKWNDVYWFTGKYIVEASD